MLPQGSRSVASPRVTRTPACATAPSAVSTTATAPHRRPCDSPPAPSAAAGPLPAPTSAGRRPKANCAQNATTASEYSATLAEKRLSDRAAREGSGVTREDLRFGTGARGEGSAQVGGE